MARPIAFAVGLFAAASLLRAATGCGTSNNNPASNPDGGEDATGNETGALSDAGDAGVEQGDTAALCNGGCLCFAVDACPAGCYPSQIAQDDGAATATFCSNGIVRCDPSGVAWSVGSPMNNCGSVPPAYVDGGPDGSFCCGTGPDAEDAAPEGGDAGADAAADEGPGDAHAE
jgi:hypothetical protein